MIVKLCGHRRHALFAKFDSIHVMQGECSNAMGVHEFRQSRTSHFFLAIYTKESSGQSSGKSSE